MSLFNIATYYYLRYRRRRCLLVTILLVAARRLLFELGEPQHKDDWVLRLRPGDDDASGVDGDDIVESTM